MVLHLHSMGGLFHELQNGPCRKTFELEYLEIFSNVGLGILEVTSGKQCPQVRPWFGRSLFSTDFVEFDQAV